MINHIELALSRLAGQFDGSENLKKLLTESVRPLQSIEQDFNDLKVNRWIESAVGQQLDNLGNIVGELRQGRDDETYRRVLLFRVFVNVSEGTPQVLLAALKFLTDPTDMQYIEVYPATVLLYTNGYFVDNRIQSQVQDVSPAGIATVPVMVSFANTPFRFTREPLPGELFVNADQDYLTANNADLQVSQGAVVSGKSALGGVVPSELDVGLGYLEVLGSPTLAVYDANQATTLGHDILTGVFQ